MRRCTVAAVGIVPHTETLGNVARKDPATVSAEIPDVTVSIFGVGSDRHIGGIVLYKSQYGVIGIGTRPDFSA